MTDAEIQELLRKAGVGEDQWKYYTASAEELPGLFGFSGSQGKRFGELFGGLGQFDPTKISEAYGAIDKYGQQQTSDIGSTFKTGRYGLSQGLMSGIGSIRENIGQKFGGFGAREKEIGMERTGAYKGAEELGRQRDMGLLNLEENLGGRRALVGGKTQNWSERLMNLVSQIYQMDAGDTDQNQGGTTSGFLQGDIDKNINFPTGTADAYAKDQLVSYFQQTGIEASQEELENYISLYSQAYKASGNTLSIADWWKSQQTGG
jgi:hypothetical protein